MTRLAAVLEPEEAGMLAAVLEAAEVGGWLAYHTHDSRRSAAGFPDLVLLRPPVLLWVELKTSTGAVSVAQRRWLAALREAGQEAHVVRPAELAWLLRVLTRRRGDGPEVLDKLPPAT